MPSLKCNEAIHITIITTISMNEPRDRKLQKLKQLNNKFQINHLHADANHQSQNQLKRHQMPLRRLI